MPPSSPIWYLSQGLQHRAHACILRLNVSFDSWSGDFFCVFACVRPTASPLWARVDAVFAGFLQGVSLTRLSQSLARQETSEVMCGVIVVNLPIRHLAHMGPAE
jgi:hypothetical protein